MNLQTKLPNALWEAIRANYEKRDFTGAILDAIYFMSDMLRNKSGVEGDGVALVGHALGGVTPKIKLNKLQSESDWNVQRGYEQMLRGLYQAIRNPRSHEKMSDSEEDAEVIILYVGFLVRQIDQAKAQFSRPDYVKRVLDPDFVPQKRYAELLVKEIPAGQRLEVFLDVYRSKDLWKYETLRHFFPVILKRLSKEERGQVYDIISEELKTVEDETTVLHIISCLGSSVWDHIDEVPRLRIENRLIRSIRDGRYEKAKKLCLAGALGTWATNIIQNFTLRQEALRVLTDKLGSQKPEEEDYVFQYFLHSIDKLSEKMPVTLDIVLRARLKSGNPRFHEALMFSEPWDTDTWSAELKQAYETFKEAEQPTKSFNDDIPF